MAHSASRHPRDPTDQQWNMIGRFLPELPRRQDSRGRPWRENRAVLNGILWILRTGAPWADLPDRYPSYQTCHRRFQLLDETKDVAISRDDRRLAPRKTDHAEGRVGRLSVCRAAREHSETGFHPHSAPFIRDASP